VPGKSDFTAERDASDEKLLLHGPVVQRLQQAGSKLSVHLDDSTNHALGKCLWSGFQVERRHDLGVEFRLTLSRRPE
jgi:hypothetical protein